MSRYRRTRETPTETELSLPREGEGYSLGHARYAKGQVILRVKPSASGMMNRAGRLAEALHGRYSNREHGFILSPSKARKFERYLAEGKDAALKFDSVYSAHYEIE